MATAQQFQPGKEIIKKPTKIGSLRIIIARAYGDIIPDIPGNSGKLQDLELFDALSILDQANQVMEWRSGMLESFLTPKEKAELKALMNRLWALAEREILA